MKLYYVPKAPVGQRWQGTQVDAKNIGRTFTSEFAQREVPVDKPNLLAFLNTEEDVIVHQRPQDIVLSPQADPIEQAELRAVAAQQPATTMSRDATLNRTTVEQFILDEASTSDIEHIFACLGTRFREATHGTS